MLNPISNLQGRPGRHLGSYFHEAIYTIFQLLLLSLLVLGIVGVTFNAVSSDGWLLGMVKRAWHRDPIYALFVIVAIVLGGGWLKQIFEERLSTVNHIGDVLIYGWLVLGVYFGTRLIITGSL